MNKRWMIICIFLVMAVSVFAHHKPGHRDVSSVESTFSISVVQFEKIMQLYDDPRYDCSIQDDEIQSYERIKERGGSIKHAKKPSHTGPKNKYKIKKKEYIECGDASDLFYNGNKTLVHIDRGGIDTYVDLQVINKDTVVDILYDVEIFFNTVLEKWNYSNFTRTWDKDDRLRFHINSSAPLSMLGRKIYTRGIDGLMVYYDINDVETTCWGYDPGDDPRKDGSCLLLDQIYYGASNHEIYVTFRASKYWDGIDLVHIDPVIYNGLQIEIPNDSTVYDCETVTNDIANESLINWSAATKTCFLNASLVINESAQFEVRNETWLIENSVVFANGITNLGNLTIDESLFNRSKPGDEGYGFDNIGNAILDMNKTTMQDFGQSETLTQCLIFQKNATGIITESVLLAPSNGCLVTFQDVTGNIGEFEISDTLFHLQASSGWGATIYDSQKIRLYNNTFIEDATTLAVGLYMSNTTDVTIDGNYFDMPDASTVIVTWFDVFTYEIELSNNVLNLSSTSIIYPIVYTKVHNISSYGNDLDIRATFSFGHFVFGAITLISFGETFLNNHDIEIYDETVRTNSTSAIFDSAPMMVEHSTITRCDNIVLEQNGVGIAALFTLNSTISECTNLDFFSTTGGIVAQGTTIIANDSEIRSTQLNIFSLNNTFGTGQMTFTNLTHNGTLVSDETAFSLLLRYYLEGLVQDEFFIPVSGVAIDVNDTDDVPVVSTTSDGAGLIGKIAINSSLYHAGTFVNYTNHVARAEIAPFSVVQSFSHVTNTFLFFNFTLNPVVTIHSITPNPVDHLQDPVTINWSATGDFIDVAFIQVFYPNGTLLIQTNETVFTINVSDLLVLGNYDVIAFANNTAGYNDTDTDDFNVIAFSDVDCFMKNDPDLKYYTERMYGVCTLIDTINESWKCISYLYEVDNNTVVSVSPDIKDFMDYRDTQVFNDSLLMDAFNEEDGLVHPYWNIRDVQTFKDYTFVLKCGSPSGRKAQFNDILEIREKLADETFSWQFFTLKNGIIIIGSLFVILFLLILLRLLWPRT